MSLSREAADGIPQGSKRKYPLTVVSETGELTGAKPTLTSDDYEERAMAAMAKRDADRARDRDAAKAEKAANAAVLAKAKAEASKAAGAGAKAASKVAKPIKVETGAVKTDPAEQRPNRRLLTKTTVDPPAPSPTASAAPAVSKSKKTPANKAYNRASRNVMDKAKRKAERDGAVFVGSDIEADAKKEAVRAGQAARDARIAAGTY